ncbi:MAG: hypothetical protein AB7G39_11900 [Alphaproteobacteria bacterium]
MNPEFRRNLWLEFSAQRLIAMPLVLGLALAAAHVSGDDPIQKSTFTASAAEGLFWIVAVLWGTRLAAGAVIGEVRDRTWDGQRLSALDPWTMAWGKLFGSTAYAWFGGGLCLAAYLVAETFATGRVPVLDAVLMVAVTLLCHATGLLSSLVYLGRRPSLQRANVSLFQAIGLLPAVIYQMATVLEPSGNWYDLALGGDAFMTVSFAAFAGWAVLGVYRRMRTTLQFRARPWAWTLFNLFLTGWLLGFVSEPGWRWSGFLAGFLLSAAWTYLLLLVEPKDLVGYRRALRDLRTGAWGRALEGMPLWSLNAIFCVLLALAILATAPAANLPPEAGFGALVDHLSAGEMPPSVLQHFEVVLAAALLFLLRDIAIMLFASMGQRTQRAELAAAVYWLVLYIALPILVLTVTGGQFSAFFYPTGIDGTALAIGAPLAEAILAWAAVAVRWRQRMRGLPAAG